MRRAYVALVGAAALFATACPRTPAGAPDAGSDADAVSDAGDASSAKVDAARDADAARGAVPGYPPLGWVHSARWVQFADEPRTSREEFMRAHGVASAKPDRSCWSKGTSLCSCARTIAIDTADGPKDVLVCERFVELPSAELVLHPIGRSVLYVAEKGTMKVVLDLPTYATVDGEDSGHGREVGSVEVLAMPSPGGLTFVDRWENDAGPWCPQAVARAAAQRGKDWLPIKRWYAAVCATAGRYVLKNGRLVKGG